MFRRRRHPESLMDGRDPGRARSIEEYLDARGRGRSARHMLDAVASDVSTLDDLASDRAWIDIVRDAPRAPDQTDRILKRLGLGAGRFDRRGHRFALFTRRLAVAGVLALAFVLGMWMRSSMMLSRQAPATQAAEHLQQVIESIPAEIDPLSRVRGLVFDVGSTLATQQAVGIEPQTSGEARNDVHERPRPRRSGPDRPLPALHDSFLPEPDAESIHILLQSLGIG